MSLGLAQGAAQNMFNAELRGATFTTPAAYWIKFHLGDPGSAGTANSASNTTRYQATFNAMTAPFLGNCYSQNTSIITLTSVPATETYTHFSLWTASSGGSFVLSGTVAGGAVVSGTSPTIAAQALIVQVSAAA